MVQRGGRPVKIADFYPTKGMFGSGETVELVLELTNGEREKVEGTARVRLSHLVEPVAELEQPFALRGGGKTNITFTWGAPRVRLQGYGADLTLFDDAGRVLATASTAFDVGARWTLAPRYGFLCEFSPNRGGVEETLRQMARYHISGIQFYDWQYRHDHLMPLEETFTDPLGRQLSLTTTRALIEAAHRRGMAAMPYTTVYAASPPFFQAHPDWVLFDEDGNPYVFGDDFLYIMNPAPRSPWTEHLLRQFEIVLREMNFDGIHLDQYGEPRAGFDAAGRLVDLAQTLPALINRVKEKATAVKPDAAVVFNAVKSWPLETVAGADQDFVYIEVWPPHTLYQDLHTLIVEAQALSGGKPVVLAVYIDPARARNVRLADAVILASGGYHIELGEKDGMLADPYFPKYKLMDNELMTVMRSYYDFAVRYENVLSSGTWDTTREGEGRMVIEGMGTDLEQVSKEIWPITRQGENFETISLINLSDVPDPEWSGLLLADPTPLDELQVRYRVERKVERVWLASPDFAGPQAMILNFELGRDTQGNYIEFTIPRLEYWDIVVFEFTN